jgi:prepilin-type N-terminal cleavage/methylation domain-containing protein
MNWPSSNPLLDFSGLPRFDRILPEHITPSIDALLGEAGKWNLDEGTLGRRLGYTAIELMVVVALIAIITAIALPHFATLVDRWRVHQEVAALQNVMRFATAQAIRTRSEVVIQAKPATCRSLRDAQNWSCGMMVFQDTNQNQVQDPDEPTLQDVPESHALTVIHAGSDNAPWSALHRHPCRRIGLPFCKQTPASRSF